MFVVVGLGNPGKRYERTRHNIGFFVIEEISKAWNIDVKRIQNKALVGKGRIKDQSVLLVKPQTFMNLSGQSVREIVSYYKVPPEKLVVIYDDIDTPWGKVRIRKKGSSGSHNGMKNIIYNLQYDNFPRIRLGIGRPYPNQDLADFVLEPFPKSEKEVLEQVVLRAAQAVETMIEDGIDLAMNRHNV